VSDDDLLAASAHLAGGRPGEAAAALRRHLATRPDDAWALQHLAFAQLRAGRRMAARDTALRARALDPGAEWAWRLWAEASLRMGDVDDARAGMTESLRLAPDDWHVHADAVRLGLFPPDETRRHAAECLRLAPDDPDAYLVAAAVAVQDGRLSQARTAYRAALALDPGHVAARRGIDDLEITAGRPDKAAVGAMAQLADAPTSTTALVHLRSVVHEAVTGIGALPALLPWGLGVVLLGLSFASEEGSCPSACASSSSWQPSRAPAGGRPSSCGSPAGLGSRRPRCSNGCGTSALYISAGSGSTRRSSSCSSWRARCSPGRDCGRPGRTPPPPVPRTSSRPSPPPRPSASR
jgi:cytochrome c-type biogenesis protein CcmH/NrfG